jgi:hypothetical protein
MTYSLFWAFKSSVMWHSVTGWAVPDIWKVVVPYTLKYQGVHCGKLKSHLITISDTYMRGSFCRYFINSCAIIPSVLWPINQDWGTQANFQWGWYLSTISLSRNFWNYTPTLRGFRIKPVCSSSDFVREQYFIPTPAAPSFASKLHSSRRVKDQVFYPHHN